MCRVFMIFRAGLDTASVSLSYGIRHLAEDKKLQSRVRREPALIGKLVEELLRRFSAAQPGRTLTRDITFEGVELKKNDRVFFMIAAANLDPSTFEDPLMVSLDRPNLPHLAFNVGPHRCVGMHLARVELQIAYEELLARLPQFRLDGERVVTASGGHVFALNEVWLRWD